MAIRSNERQIIAGLTGRAMQEPAIRGQQPFDPTEVSVLIKEQGTGWLRLQKTDFIYPSATYTETDERPGRSAERIQNVGHKTVAVFAEIDTPLDRGSAIIHRQAHLGLWLRKPTPEELEPLNGGDPRHAWIFEAVVPLAGMPDTVEPTGIVSEIYVPEAL